jgi:hypothetical protein
MVGRTHCLRSEGMVVKPLQFVGRNRRGLIQPAIKCRSREYRRIIYGPEYTAPEHLERLRARGLGTNRSLALREFVLEASNDSSSANRSDACMSVYSVCWHWKASLSIRGCERTTGWYFGGWSNQEPITGTPNGITKQIPSQ